MTFLRWVLVISSHSKPMLFSFVKAVIGVTIILVVIFYTYIYLHKSWSEKNVERFLWQEIISFIFYFYLYTYYNTCYSHKYLCLPKSCLFYHFTKFLSLYSLDPCVLIVNTDTWRSD
jgi:hypothetical protein